MSEEERAPLLLIDLSSVYWQAWHSAGAEEGGMAAHDACVSRVRGMATRWAHVAICCDSPNGSWRRDMFAAYKGTRGEKDPSAIGQLRRVVATLELDGFPLWQVDAHEADDVIAGAVAYAPPGLPIVIATGDKDLAQLVGPNVRILSVQKGDMLGPDEVRAKFGVGPAQIGDFLALVGDKVDNVPGVPGVGNVTAAKLLGDFGDLFGILDACRGREVEGAEGEMVVKYDERIKPKCREAILANEQQLALSRRLVDLRTPPVNVEEALKPRKLKPLPSANAKEWNEDMKESETMNDENDPIDPETAAENDRLAKRPTTIEQVAGVENVRRLMAVDAPEQPQQQALTTYSEPTQHAVIRATAGSDEWAMALEPQTPAAAWKIAGAFFDSRLFGGINSREGVFSAIMMGRTLGVPAATILRNTYVVKGKLSLSAQFQIGLVLKSGKADFFKCVESTASKAVWRTHRRGDPDPQATVCEWTIEDAERAGLIRQNQDTWGKYAKQMLRWRAGLDLARMVYPDLIGGLYSPDELGAEPAAVDLGRVA